VDKKVAFLFDVDGVIVNTPHEESWRTAAINLGVISEEFDFKSFYQKNIAGIPGLEGARKILEISHHYKNANQKEKNEAAKKLREIKQKFLEQYIGERKVGVFNDIISIVKSAKENKIPISAVSSSENAERILKSINLFDVFDSTTLGAIKHRTPRKEYLYSFAFGKLCEKLGIRDLPYPIVFEDADKGILAVKSLDYLCIGIARGSTTEESLLELGADLTYNEQKLAEKGYKGVMKDIEEILKEN